MATLFLSRAQIDAITKDDRQATRTIELLIELVNSLVASGGLPPDGNYGDIDVSAAGTSWDIVAGAVSNAKLADMTGPTFKARVSGTGAPQDVSAVNATAMLSTMSPGVRQGVVPDSGTVSGRVYTDAGTFEPIGAVLARGGIPPGLPGADGEDGPPGPPGRDGVIGRDGAQGAQGAPGFNGEDGADGFPGPPGNTGPAGATGATGPTGPPGPAGADGDDGPMGPPGRDGAPGAAGAAGVAGQMGPPGFAVDGEDGAWGPPGRDGVAGRDGAAGQMGPPGFAVDGEDGAMGFPGATGPAGAAGAMGPMGFMGPPGDDGDEGPMGFPGPPGPAGPQAAGDALSADTSPDFDLLVSVTPGVYWFKLDVAYAVVGGSGVDGLEIDTTGGATYQGGSVGITDSNTGTVPVPFPVPTGALNESAFALSGFFTATVGGTFGFKFTVVGSPTSVTVKSGSGILVIPQTSTSAVDGTPRLNELLDPNGPVQFAQQQALQFRIENRTSDPASPAVGEIWLRTDL